MRSNIKQLRKQQNISQKILGEQIGLSQQAISRMERDRSKIQVDVLITLADYFRVSTDCVLGYSAGDTLENQEEITEAPQETVNEDVASIMDNWERMDQTKRQELWQILAELKRYL